MWMMEVRVTVIRVTDVLRVYVQWHSHHSDTGIRVQ